MSIIKPLSNTVLFTFLDETSGASGKFAERTASGIILQGLQKEQKEPRWGQVFAVGPEVEGISIGEYILIDALMWTEHEMFNGQKLWKTNEEKIIMVTDDVKATVTW